MKTYYTTTRAQHYNRTWRVFSEKTHAVVLSLLGLDVNFGNKLVEICQFCKCDNEMGGLLKILTMKWAVQRARAYKIVGNPRYFWSITLFARCTAHFIVENFAHTIPKFTFNSKSTETDLLNFLTKIGCRSSEVTQLRKEAELFRQEFLINKTSFRS